MQKLKIALLVSIVILLCSAKGVMADGMLIPPSNYYINETQQEAVIVYENSTETLIISPSFQGNAQEFGWLIPTPSQPNVSKGNDELFTALHDLVTPENVSVYTYKGAPLGYGATKENDVTVLESKKVDIYDVAVLSATDSKALNQWLKDNGFQTVPSTTILDEYLQNGWYFTAAKISTQDLTATTTNQLKTGHATPIQLQFESPNIVYPLKISSINLANNTYPYPPPYEYQYDDYSNTYPYYNDYVTINLYVFADGKKTVPGYATQYANWIAPDKLQDLALDINGDPWYQTQNKLYVTYLTRNLQPSEMTSDIILRNAENNDTVNAPLPVTFSPYAIVIIAAILIVELGLLVYFLVIKPKHKQQDKGEIK